MKMRRMMIRCMICIMKMRDRCWRNLKSSVMKSKIIEIFLLILYINLLNIPFVLAGKYCIVPSLVQYGYNIRILGCMQDLYESEFFICLLVMYFVLTAKYKVKSFMLFVVLHNALVVLSWFDQDPFIGEFLFHYGTSISRFTECLFLLYIRIEGFWFNILNKINWSLLFCLYVYFTLYSYRLILRKIAPPK